MNRQHIVIGLGARSNHSAAPSSPHHSDDFNKPYNGHSDALCSRNGATNTNTEHHRRRRRRRPGERNDGGGECVSGARNFVHTCWQWQLLVLCRRADVSPAGESIMYDTKRPAGVGNFNQQHKPTHTLKQKNVLACQPAVTSTVLCLCLRECVFVFNSSFMLYSYNVGTICEPYVCKRHSYNT